MLQKLLILSIVVGICVAATVTVPKPDEVKDGPVVEELKTAERNSRQFGHGGKRSQLNFG